MSLSYGHQVIVIVSKLENRITLWGKFVSQSMTNEQDIVSNMVTVAARHVAEGLWLLGTNPPHIPLTWRSASHTQVCPLNLY